MSNIVYKCQFREPFANQNDKILANFNFEMWSGNVLVGVYYNWTLVQGSNGAFPAPPQFGTNKDQNGKYQKWLKYVQLWPNKEDGNNTQQRTEFENQIMTEFQNWSKSNTQDVAKTAALPPQRGSQPQSKGLNDNNPFANHGNSGWQGPPGGPILGG